jgi:hypothetical protein
MNAPFLPDYEGGSIRHREADHDVTRGDDHDHPRPTPYGVQLAAHLRALHDHVADRHAAGNDACAASRMRCGGRFCVSCSVKKAKGERKKIERILRNLHEGIHVAMLTLTLGCDDLGAGLDVLTEEFSALRRSKMFAPVIGGRGQVEIVAAQGDARAWNAHVHVACWHEGAPPSRRLLRGTWRAAVAAHGLPGSADWTKIDRRFSDASRTFLAARVLLHEEARPRLGRPAGPHAAAARSRAARPPAGRLVPGRAVIP